MMPLCEWQTAHTPVYAWQSQHGWRGVGWEGQVWMACVRGWGDGDGDGGWGQPPAQSQVRGWVGDGDGGWGMREGDGGWAAEHMAARVPGQRVPAWLLTRI
jgi:hypothetical protein